MSESDLPLQGLKVLDISQGVAGPHCGMLLARHGADVVKLEPLIGDWGRRIGRTYGDNCAYGIAFNQGKRSLALNLKNSEGNKIARRLAYKADVLIENNRPGITTRLGLGYEIVKNKNPDIIYLSITGFGQSGPNANLPATDSIMQAFSGLMFVNKGNDGLPQRINLLAIDVVTGLYGFQAIVPALYRRVIKGGGAYIHTSLMEAIGAFQSAKLIEYQLEGGSETPLGVPIAMFAAKDGFLNINGRRDEHFNALCEIIGHPELSENPKFMTPKDRLENETELMPLLRTAIAEMPISDLSEKLTRADVLHAHVQTYGDYLQSDHVRAVEAIGWIEQSGVGIIPMPNIPGVPPLKDGDPLAHTPHLGEHSQEILAELGYTNAQVEDLIVNRAIAVHNKL